VEDRVDELGDLRLEQRLSPQLEDDPWVADLLGDPGRDQFDHLVGTGKGCT
jgi:hypothetical protein